MKLKIYWSHRCAGEWANMLFYFSLRTHKSIILLQYLQFGSLRVSRVETNTRIIIVISYEMDLHMFPIHVYVLRTEWERWRTSSQSIQPLTFENSKLNYKRRVLSLSTVGTWLRRRRRWYGITASDIHIHRAWFISIRCTTYTQMWQLPSQSTLLTHNTLQMMLFYLIFDFFH